MSDRLGKVSSSALTWIADAGVPLNSLRKIAGRRDIDVKDLAERRRVVLLTNVRPG
jgi:hypothetical protein